MSVCDKKKIENALPSFGYRHVLVTNVDQAFCENFTCFFFVLVCSIRLIPFVSGIGPENGRQ